ncbi:hypothetical protein PP939_gp177 [Rhizobium phage RL38J1]|uniref:Uncharacterized protein n=1 Tax=Rhizobium phage RL38J1 TaxID=2663232 RepID=A0A6B9J5Q4_9CAUD|nr:hypothetical protein PP939_gp177 [Rhizobium phage RL38J1]QGZ14075.1 hypothetical protein RL38J1_177 [Rhizobium phage RL38J1]
MSERIAVSRGYCSYCNEQRDETGDLKHSIECSYSAAVDLDYMRDGERTKVFCPYLPSKLPTISFT